MKIGETKEEKYARYKILKQKEFKIFAWYPRFCWDTDRFVWLEYVYKRYLGYYKHECESFIYEKSQYN